MDVAKRGHSWFGIDRRGRRSSKGVDCDILTQGLIGLIEYCFAKKRIDRIFIPSRYTFFSGSLTAKNYEVKRAWPEAILGWVTDREVFPGAHE
jgi:hypothetical protein